MAAPPPGATGAAAPGAAGAGARTDLWGPLGASGQPPAPPIQDYATSVARYTDDDQWSQLDERYEISMEWARQIDLKWQPVRKAELHYHLAALGLAIARPSADRDVIHPEQIALQGQRLRERYVDEYVRTQRDLIPPQVMENLLESAKLAVERHTRLVSPESMAGEAESGSIDSITYQRRLAEELEYLIEVYLVGNDAAPWCRTAYDPEDRVFTDEGIPVLEKQEPTYFHSDSARSGGRSLGAGGTGSTPSGGGAASAGPSGGGGARGGGGPSLPAGKSLPGGGASKK
jgi:hypothetical protein